MHEVHVDGVGLQAPEAVFAGADEVVARRALVVRAVTHRERGFGGDQRAIASAAQRRTEDRLGGAPRVDVRGVEEVDPVVEAQVDEAGGLGDVGAPPAAEELAHTAEGSGSKGKDGDFEAAAAEGAVLQTCLQLLRRTPRCARLPTAARAGTEGA